MSPRRLDLASLGLGALLAIGVCFPWMGGGRLLLLDWVHGPHQTIVPPQAFGLGGGVTAGLPFDIVVNTLARLLGSAGTWIPVALVFPIATFAIGRLVGGSLLCRLGAGLIYAVNPMVFDRLYAGQIPFLIGYALLPLATRALLDVSKPGGEGARYIWRAILYIAGLVAIDAHFAWILAVVGLAIVISSRRLRSLVRIVGAAAVAAIISCYAIVTPLVSHAAVVSATQQVSFYPTAADPRFGLLANVAGLYGFWRPEGTEPKDLVSGWPAILLAIYALALFGLVSALGDNKRRRPAIAVSIAGGAGFLLALGTAGPTGALYGWAIGHVPGFLLMREAQKFDALLALALACGIGWGLQGLVGSRRTATTLALTGLLGAGLCFAYTPNLLGGLGGQIRTSHYPQSWAAAARRVAGDEGLLVLPFDEYLPFPFTGSRSIADPAPGYFPAGTVIGSADPGDPNAAVLQPNPLEAYISDYVGDYLPPPSQLGRLIAPLGVRYVLLEKDSAGLWQNYDWLGRQRDLRRVLEAAGVELYENLAPPPRPARRVTELSPVEYSVAAGKPGEIGLPIAYTRGWSLGGKPASKGPAGNLEFHVGAASATIEFTPFRKVVAGEAISLAALVVVAVLAILTRRRHRR